MLQVQFYIQLLCEILTSLVTFSVCVCVGGGEYSVSRMVCAVLNALDSLSNTRQGLTFTWRSSNKYCFNISGHMVLIALYIFSTGLFRLHPSTWLAELV